MAQEDRKIVTQNIGRWSKVKTPEQRLEAFKQIGFQDQKVKNQQYAATADAAIGDTREYSTPGKVGSTMLGILTLGQVNVQKNWEEKEAKRYANSLVTVAGGGAQRINELRGLDQTVAGQSLDIQKEFQERAQKQLEAIQKGTLEQYERGLLQGQTVQEVASSQRAARVGYTNEAANQQRASLFAQNEYAKQQYQQQGEQSQLKLQQLTGARGIGNSSVQDQILNRQRTETVGKEAQAQEELGQGLSQVAESKSKQIAEINADINKDMQQRQTDMQNSFDTKNQQARQNIIEQQQAGVTQVQNAYASKRTEIDQLVVEVNKELDKIKMAAS